MIHKNVATVYFAFTVEKWQESVTVLRPIYVAFRFLDCESYEVK